MSKAMHMCRESVSPVISNLVSMGYSMYDKKNVPLGTCAISQCQLFHLVPSCIYQVQAKAKSFARVNNFRFYICFPFSKYTTIVLKIMIVDPLYHFHHKRHLSQSTSKL